MQLLIIRGLPLNWVIVHDRNHSFRFQRLLMLSDKSPFSNTIVNYTIWEISCPSFRCVFAGVNCVILACHGTLDAPLGGWIVDVCELLPLLYYFHDCLRLKVASFTRKRWTFKNKPINLWRRFQRNLSKWSDATSWLNCF